MDWLSILPNLGIGVAAIWALVFVCDLFVKTLDKRADANEAAMQEREVALRAVEKEVRQEISSHLHASTAAVARSNQLYEQMITRKN